MNNVLSSLKKVPRKYLIPIASVFVVLIVGSIVTLASSLSGDIQASIKSVSKTEAKLIISRYPSGTQSISYQLSYQAKEKGIQGVVGTIDMLQQQGTYEKQITLGTCSTGGTCVYHDVQGPVSLSLTFNGSYGEQYFERQFRLN